jgi:2-polyprenyl-3-methyl-5-hydroxy-6-metoxy-1,4-benzoquinol methylase
MHSDFDMEKAQQFLGTLVSDAAAAGAMMQICLGERLGLFTALAEAGPTTPAALAARTGLSQPYLEDWLGGLAAGGYLTFDATTGAFTLPQEHAAILADANSPLYMTAFGEVVVSSMTLIGRLEQAFRDGHGIAHREYPHDYCRAMGRLTYPMFRQAVPGWLRAVPRAAAALDDGASYLDAGCGAGSAAIAVAEAFPKASVLGVDLDGGAIERARVIARERGFEARARFEVGDCAKLPRGEFDVITAALVVHDACDPVALLTSLRNALRPNGTFVMIELNASPRVEDNLNPLGRFFYAQNLFYCRNVSLADGGAGLGGLLGEAKLRELAAQAGFGPCERLPLDDPFMAVYALGR